MDKDFTSGWMALHDAGAMVADLKWGREDGRPCLALRRFQDTGITDVGMSREQAVDICAALDLLEKAIRKALPPARPATNERWIDQYYGPKAPAFTGD